MTDETDAPDSPAADEIRRLLGAARHTEPMPAEVAARMDAVLADLAQHPAPGSVVDGHEPSNPSVAPVVVPLSAHRRRRAASLLVAAAAIVVGGVTVAQHLPGSGVSSGATTADARGAETGNSSDSTTGRDQSEAISPGPDRAPSVAAPARVRHGRLVVRKGHFDADALAGRRFAVAAPLPGLAGNDAATSACVSRPQRGQVLKATYQRLDAALVYRRPAGSTQVVELFVCGSTRPIRSVTLPVP